MTKETKDKEIDYRAEGGDNGSTVTSSTDAGYDEAAHSGESRYGVAEGAGGVFGTTGGGTFSGGMHIIERDIPYASKEGPDESGEPKEKPSDQPEGRTGQPGR